MTRPAHPDPLVVTVWSDIGCPWASLALHVLRDRARERAMRLLIDHRAFPLELFNAEPTPKRTLDADVAVLSEYRPELGWAGWQRPDWQYPVTTLLAMEAVQAAKDPTIGGLLGSDELDEALRQAFFAESRCISLHSEILDVAAGCPHVHNEALADALAEGTHRAALHHQWRVASRPDIQGSPHLFTATGYAEHNPGVRFHRAGDEPVIDHFDTRWTDELLDRLREPRT
ncbi:MAG TPA: dithiol-disulfide isomerase [Pseudonocardiaceae bacterium]|nr:dithiol-disulfide isomerase [Pseudonocardiaceae bacterium]